MGLITWATAWAAWRTQRDHPTLVRLALLIAVLFPIQALIGGLQVLTQLAEWTQTLHLALGAVIWTLASALAVAAYYEARTATVPAEIIVGAGGSGSGGDEAEATPRTRGETVRAYIALTKPRIIELLLVTTIPRWSSPLATSRCRSPSGCGSRSGRCCAARSRRARPTRSTSTSTATSTSS